MSKHFNRKWADDNEAVNCTSCGKQFSVTVRKVRRSDVRYAIDYRLRYSRYSQLYVNVMR